MRRTLVSLAIGTSLWFAPYAAAQQPTLYGYVDTAQVDVVGRTTLLFVQGWSVGPNVDLVGSIYIDGMYAASGIVERRDDVCSAFHAQGSPCGMDLFKPCSEGATLINSASCVGVKRLFNITGLASGSHVAQICLLHAQTTSSTPYMACSPPKAFIKP